MISLTKYIHTLRKRCQCYINSDSNEHCQGRKIFKRELTNLPQFVRFDRVELDYQITAKALAVAKKCQSVVNYLQPLKLNDSNLIYFYGIINQNNRSHFSDYSQLLDNLRNELLPKCGLSRGYKFEICLFSHEVSHTNLIAQILQLPRIDCCSNVEINLPLVAMHPLQFPIEPISNWLHRKGDGTEEKSKGRFLRINFFNHNSLCNHNSRELVDHLKKVTIVHLFENFG